MNAQAFLTLMAADSLIERFGWVLVHSLWQFTLLGLSAFVLLALMKKATAAVRHGTLMVHLVLLVLLPLSTWLVLGEKAASSGSANEASFPITPKANREIGESPALAVASSNDPVPVEVLPIEPGISSIEISPGSGNSSSFLTTQEEPSPILSPVSWVIPFTDLVRPWLNSIVVVWFIGLVLFSIRPVVGWWTLRRLKTQGLSPVSETVVALVRSLSRRMGFKAPVRVFQSTLAEVPLLVGYLQPMILLPVSLVAGIPVSQLESILIHELAHVRRHDFVVNLLQTLVETIFFYHPAVWFLSSRIRIERENCCDDLVVGMVQDRAEYGRALLAVEELRGNQTVLALGAGDGSLLARVRRILIQEPKASNRLSRWPWVTLIPLCLGLGMVFQQLGAATRSEPSLPEVESTENQTPETKKEQLTVQSTFSIIGRILMPDGSPATGARVRAVLWGPGTLTDSRRETKVNDQGKFTLSLPVFPKRGGQWVVSANRSEDWFGQYEKRVSVDSLETPVTRPEPEDIKDLKLQPGRKIQGWVLAQKDRKPLAKAVVWSSDGQMTETDEKGVFEIHGLSHDVQQLLVTSPGLVRTRVNVDLSEQETGRVKILMAPGGTVEGEITHQGKPLKDAAVFWGSGRSQMAAGLTELADRETGKFVYEGLPLNRLLMPMIATSPGMENESTDMIAIRPGNGTRPFAKIQMEKVQPDKPNGFFGGLAGDNTKPTGSIRGKVTLGEGIPVQDFTVHLLPNFNLPYDENGSYSTSSFSFFSEDGTFAIGQLDAGKKYRVAVSCPCHMRAVANPVTARVFQPNKLGDIEVTPFHLKPSQVNVEMVVRDGKTQKPIPDAMVCFIPDIWPQNKFEWNYLRNGSQVQWSDHEGKILWDRMEVDEGMFFVEHPGYGRGHLSFRVPRSKKSNDPKENFSEIHLGKTVYRKDQNGKYQVDLILNPEARLEVKINNAGGRNLQSVFVNVEQPETPMAENRKSGSHLYVWISNHTKKSKEGDLFRFDGLNPCKCKITLRDLEEEAINQAPGPFLKRDIELVEGVYRLELDLPPRSKPKAVVPEKASPPETKEPGPAKNETLESLKREMKVLLLELGKEHPKVVKLRLQIEELEKNQPPELKTKDKNETLESLKLEMKVLLLELGQQHPKVVKLRLQIEELEKTPNPASTAKARSLLRERVQLCLDGMKSGNVKLEEAIGACKDLGDFDPREALTYLKEFLVITEKKVEAGISGKRDLIAAQAAWEVMKLKVNAEMK